MFLMEDDEYIKRRTVKPYKTYIQNKEYFAKKMGINKEEFVKYCKGSIKDPTIHFYHRDEKTFDKEIIKSNLSKYILDIEERDYTVAPSLTCYSKKIYALDADWSDTNVALRNEFKIEAKKAKMDKDIIKEKIFQPMQQTKKIKNNSLSGIYSVESTPLHVHSAHYSLTSTTRLESGIGNILTERMVAGNRFYRVKDDVIDDMVTYIRSSNYKIVKKVVSKYNLHIPTVDEIMHMVKESSEWYWKDPIYMEFIKTFVKTLDDIEKVIVLYAHDLYHLKKFNSDFIVKMFEDFYKEKPITTNDMSAIKNGDYDIRNATHMIFYKELKGMKIDYDTMGKSNIGKRLVSKYLDIEYTLKQYQDFIDAFFRKVHCIPINVQFIKEMIRKVIVLSDTDSTCGALFNLVKHPNELFDINKDHIARVAPVVLFLSGTMNHCLRIFAVNTFTTKDKIDKIQMKAEYIWSFFLPALVSKHYMTSEAIIELYALPETNITFSGAAYISSTMPLKYRNLMDEFRTMIKNQLENGKRLDIKSVLNFVKDVEKSIRVDIDDDIFSVLRSDKMKDEASYQQDWTRSNFFNHVFSKKVLASIYGEPPAIPYRMIRVPLTLDTANKVKKYLASYPDKEFTTNMGNLLREASKTKLATIKLPISLYQEKDIPKEFRGILDYDKIISNIITPFHMLLASLGVFVYEDTLVIDNY